MSNNARKLTDYQIEEMKQRFVDGASIEGLRKFYRVSYSTAYGHCMKVRHRRTLPMYQHQKDVPAECEEVIDDMPHLNRQYLIALHHEALAWIRVNRLEDAE